MKKLAVLVLALALILSGCASSGGQQPQDVAAIQKAADVAETDAADTTDVAAIQEAADVAETDAADTTSDFTTSDFATTRQVAEQGDARAQLKLGVMYMNGLGVAKDERQAVEWYRKAAQQGDVEAQQLLGLMYLAGRGVIRDRQIGCNFLLGAVVRKNRQAIDAYNNYCTASEAELKRLDDIARLREAAKTAEAPKSDLETKTGRPQADSETELKRMNDDIERLVESAKLLGTP